MKWTLLLLFITYSAFGQRSFVGKIVDMETGKPVPFASVGIVGTSRGTSSNLNGEFSMDVKGEKTIRITCIGYESLELKSISSGDIIRLKPAATQLKEVVVFNKEVNPARIVRKAFNSVSENFDKEPFLQKFFYRHYCKDDSEYGRLIEASVDVWKDNGYKYFQQEAGQKDEIRVTQLRRSLDRTTVAQGHTPIAIKSILQADIASYQTLDPSPHLPMFKEVSNLKADMLDYTFSFEGITNYDGEEVYEIKYQYKRDSALANSGRYVSQPRAHGTLFITLKNYAFVKAEEVRYHNLDTIHTATFYRKYGEKYYPYHFIRDGKHFSSNKSMHWFHIDLMSAEVRHGEAEKFSGQEPGKEELLNIPYDSAFWNNNTVLKTTPLEDEIISDLGGGQSLERQFFLYRQHELNLRDGGINGIDKFNWYKEESKGRRNLYLVFWSSEKPTRLYEFEYLKVMNARHRNNVTFVLISVDEDEERWKQALTKYNLFVDGLVNFRIGRADAITDLYKVGELPSFVLISRDGNVLDYKAKSPSDRLLEEDFKALAGVTPKQ